MVTSPTDLFCQITFPFNALKKSELFYLASNYPKEFQDFIVGLRPLRCHEAMLGEASTFPLGDSKFFIRGMNTRTPFKQAVSDIGKVVPFWHSHKTQRNSEIDEDEVAEQVVSGYFLPLKHAAHPRLLLTYVDVCNSSEAVWLSCQFVTHGVPMVCYLFSCN